MNGVPALPRSIARREWIEAMQAGYDRLVRAAERGRDTFIDPYATESADEYFAVVSELHFSSTENLPAGHVRVSTRDHDGRIELVGESSLADTPRVFAEIDGWIRHRLRALQLKQWKRGTTMYRELRARGAPERAAAIVARNSRRWWRNSAMLVHVALPNSLYDRLGLPRLAA